MDSHVIDGPIVIKRIPHYVANLGYPAKNDKFFAGERRIFPFIPKD
jgi:hypothetical protein